MKKKNIKMNFDSLPASLETIVTRSQEELKKFVDYWLNIYGYFPISNDGYVYAAGNIPVMLVAHMDTVHKETIKEIYVSNFGNVTSPEGIGGDDRCGVYSILSIIADLKPYVLFTEDEELGGIGAEKFIYDYQDNPKQFGNIDIDFIIEIDRRGSNDAVYYDCDNAEFEKFISSYGYKTQWGSFSDISLIAPELGVAAVNLSSGYYNAHTTSEYINIPDLEHTIETVKQILTEVPTKYGRKKYEYIEAVRNFKYSGYSWRDKNKYGRITSYDWCEDYYNFQMENEEKNEMGFYYIDNILASFIPEDCYIIDPDNKEVSFTEGEFFITDTGNVFAYEPDCDGYVETDYLAFTMDGVMLNANMLPAENLDWISVYDIDHDYDRPEEEEEYESETQISMLDGTETKVKEVKYHEV